MSYREPPSEDKAHYHEQSKLLWAAYKEREGLLIASGIGYESVYRDQDLEVLRLAARQHDNSCPACGGIRTRMENYSVVWREADIVCVDCDTYIRGWDAG